MINPEPQFTHVLLQIKQLHPDLAYMHLVELRVDGGTSRNVIPAEQEKQRDVLHQLWSPKPIVSAGGLDRALGLQIAEKEEGGLIAYGRHFISNVSVCTSLSTLSCGRLNNSVDSPTLFGD